MGGRAFDEMRESLEAPGLERASDVLGRARVAVRLPVAAAGAWIDRDGVRGTRQALDADPRRVRRGRLRRRVRTASRRGPVRRDDGRALPRRGEWPQALRDRLQPVALGAATA